MEAYAIHKGAIIKPRLARMTMDLVRGKDVKTARAILETTNTKASTMILKVLNSAVANAVNNFGAKESDLVIKECFVNPGTIIKRIQFASRGNVDRHDKRTSHIKVVVTDNKVMEGDVK
jgi:large subunit ribosomal protein L22